MQHFSQGHNNPYQTGAFPPYSRQFQNFPPQSFAPQRPAPSQIEVFQVSSVEEARAQIPNPLAPTIFCNFGQNEIYIKHVDNNGQGQFHTFKLIVDVTPEPENPWVPIQQKLESIELLLGSLKHDHPVSESANESKSVPATVSNSGAKTNVASAASISTKSAANVAGKN